MLFGFSTFFGFLIFCPFLPDDFFVLRFPPEMRSHKHATQNSSKSHARLYTGLSRVDMNSTQLSFNDCTNANSAALQGVRQQASRHTQSIHFEVAPLVIIFVPFPARIHRGIEHSNMRQEVMMKMPIQHNNTTQHKTKHVAWLHCQRAVSFTCELSETVLNLHSRILQRWSVFAFRSFRIAADVS
jgi:hypothetical protein